MKTLQYIAILLSLIWLSENVSSHFHLLEENAIELCNEKHDDKQEKSEKECMLDPFFEDLAYTQIDKEYTHSGTQLYISPDLNIPDLPPEQV